jgi:CBS domain-containing protein
MACVVPRSLDWRDRVNAPRIEQRQEGNVDRGRDQSDRSRESEPTARDVDREGSPESTTGQADASGGDPSQPRGFFMRATERRIYVRPRQSSREAFEGASGEERARGRDRGVSRGAARESEERGYLGRNVRGYGGMARDEPGGGHYGQGTGEFERGREGYGGGRDEYAGERQNRQARGRDAGPYPEGRSSRHYGLPADLRAGEGQSSHPGGYAELNQERGGYEPGYESGEWSPGGDASVPLRMGYGDYGVRGEGRRSESGRRSRWRREPVLARDIMTSNPTAVRPEASIREIARIMRDENTGIVPVCDAGGTLLGVVTDRDIVMRTLASEDSPLQATARDVMTDDVEAVTPDEELHDVVHLMGEHQVRRIPVVERGDRLIGIISMADVATRADFDEDLQDALEDISARRSFWSRLFR